MYPHGDFMNRSIGGHFSPSSPEPMLLGSPTNASPSPGMGDNYLPSLLLGENVYSLRQRPLKSPPRSSPWNTGGGLTNNHPQQSYLSPFDEPNQLHSTFDQSLNRSIYTSPTSISNAYKSGSGHQPIQRNPSILRGSSPVSAARRANKLQAGPPMNSLWDCSPIVNNNLAPNDESEMRPKVNALNRSSTFDLNMSSANQFDKSCFTEMPPEEDDLWITLFGYPPDAGEYILGEFKTYGNVTKHIAVAGSNWMHIRFANRIQVRKALSKNGKVYGKFMVGVLPCKKELLMVEQEMVQDDVSEFNLSRIDRINMSRLDEHSDLSQIQRGGSTSNWMLQSSRIEEPLPSTHKIGKSNLTREGSLNSSMRRLDDSYRGSLKRQLGANSDENVAPESGGIISKALGYVFRRN